MKTKDAAGPDRSDPLWYKDAVIYELHARAFYDSDGDGAGDFRGITEKLGYLQDLGVTAVWVLPFCPSPWRDDGYDISSYTDVHPAYGTIRDFQAFLKEAHRRGIRVITELVVNHTSDQHAWFQRARNAPVGSRSRDFYVWSDDPTRYSQARIIFKDFETSNWTWDPIAKAYYWHRFYSHQPDLNFDSPHVRRAVIKAMDFWLDMGVDGLRLDAVPYLYEREGTNCENLPETHAFLRELRRHIDSKYTGRLLLAEANQWPEDAVPYFGNGDECHMSFHFPLMPRLFMALRMEEYLPIVDILEQTPSIPDNCQWALFLRNHDELTLEMVTDEERDYMYRVYAHDPQARINLGIRRRLAPLLGNQRRRIELMNALLFSLPGTPVLYYGDEIGMGDNVYLGDRNGVRTPMQWSGDRNAGFSRSNPQRLFLPVIIDPAYHYESINVEAQQGTPGSLLWWMKRIIGIRKQFRALSRGSIEFLHPENRRVLAFTRTLENERALVVANLSRFPQAVELDLRALSGLVPVEMFGRSAFPPIRETPYILTLAPHGFFWFSLEPAWSLPEAPFTPPAERERIIPTLSFAAWRNAISGRLTPEFERLLPTMLRSRSWFQGRNRVVRATQIAEVLPLSPERSYLVLIQVEYGDGEADLYTSPLAIARGEHAAELLRSQPEKVGCRLMFEDGSEGLVFGGIWDDVTCQLLLDGIAKRRQVKGLLGELVSYPLKVNPSLNESEPLAAAPSNADQHNTSIVYGDRLILKLFRRLEEGISPDLELGRFLTERTTFRNIPPIAGAIEYRKRDSASVTVGILHGYVPHLATGWQYTIDSISRFFEQALTHNPEEVNTQAARSPLELIDQPMPALATELMQNYTEDARLLGRRTAELHVALGSDLTDPNFAPEPFTDFYRQGLYHGMLGLTTRCVQLLRQRIDALRPDQQGDARRVIDSVVEVRKRFRPLRDLRLGGMRTRQHGDYHLGQVLYTGKDFILIDLEGESRRPFGERRLKRSPLRDVAAMLRSFYYASSVALLGRIPGVVAGAWAEPAINAWGRFWFVCAGAAFLKGYLAAAEPSGLLPPSLEETRVLLNAHLLEKSLNEVIYELTNRPDWVRIPLRHIIEQLDAPTA